ncbi:MULTISPECIES: TlpA family protein disulfide reductase [Butyricimonas]|uniref:TlpA family protein disulfide reductase n=1 Tax=Butyricimonas TaxID=574697 RepID=UPI0016524F2A|nr:MULTISPECIES: TlpA family protein disulfide reductase [Butyricimonas]
MRTRNIILACIMLCSGVCAVLPGYAQQQKSKDQIVFDKIYNAYNRIPGGLNKDELVQKVNEVEREVKLCMDSLSGKEARQKAELLCYNGVLWSMGRLAIETKDEALKNEIAQRVKGLDLDSPSLELLADVERTNLLNGYFQLFMPDLSALNRATYVLYNIKSEEVRNPYVLSTLVTELKQRGYTDEVNALMEDIELCSKTEATRRQAIELKERYYPARAGAMAPDFEMEDENGKMVKLSDFRGKAVFIDVWATWCGGCVAGLPAFIALKEQYKDQKDVVFLTISDDGIEAKARWKNFLKEKKYSGIVPHLIINKEKDQFTENYCITGIPRYILIDKRGKIVNAWHVGANHEFFPFFFSMELEGMNRE